MVDKKQQEATKLKLAQTTGVLLQYSHKINTGKQTAMSQRYQDHAKEVYRKFYEEMEAGLKQAEASGKPILVVNGEYHRDSDIEAIANLALADEAQDPALGIAYSHIAAIKAAEELAGKENIVISMELPPQTTEKILASGLLDLNNPPKNEDVPAAHALFHILREKYNFEETDTGFGYGTYSPHRYKAENQAIAAIPNEHPDAKIIVHIGGLAHLLTLSGYDPEYYAGQSEDLSTLKKEPPFNNQYGSVLMFNNCPTVCTNIGIIHENVRPLSAEFATSAANAIQIRAPGRMDEDDKVLDTIVARIEAAAANYRPAEEITPSPETTSQQALTTGKLF